MRRSGSREPSATACARSATARACCSSWTISAPGSGWTLAAARPCPALTRYLVPLWQVAGQRRTPSGGDGPRGAAPCLPRRSRSRAPSGSPCRRDGRRRWPLCGQLEETGGRDRPHGRAWARAWGRGWRSWLRAHGFQVTVSGPPGAALHDLCGVTEDTPAQTRAYCRRVVRPGRAPDIPTITWVLCAAHTGRRLILVLETAGWGVWGDEISLHRAQELSRVSNPTGLVRGLSRVDAGLSPKALAWASRFWMTCQVELYARRSRLLARCQRTADQRSRDQRVRESEATGATTTRTPV